MAAGSPQAGIPTVLVGRSFGEVGLKGVREELAGGEKLSRAEIARRVCRRLGWRTPGGELSLMSARVALLRLHRGGLIRLPPPRNGNANGRAVDLSGVDWPGQAPLQRRVDQLPGLALHPVLHEHQSTLYNALIGWEGGWLGALGFGAAAWQVRDRDRFIGWDHARRRVQLHRIVGNSRFLLLPWVRCPHLASKLLAMSARRLAPDFRERYGYSPVLVESFVEEGRFQATSYRAANWRRVGWTQGRGKKGQWDEPRLPRKSIWVYPLHRRFRQILCTPEPLP